SLRGLEPRASFPVAFRPEREAGAALEVREVTKRFGGLTALDGVTLSVAQGSIHGIVGPNGSGKTTLFNIATGVYGPTGGEVRAFGERVSGRAAYRICGRGV